MAGITDDQLAQLNARGRGALDEKMGIEILEASPERLVGRMPVAGNTQPFGRDIDTGGFVLVEHHEFQSRVALVVEVPERGGGGVVEGGAVFGTAGGVVLGTVIGAALGGCEIMLGELIKCPCTGTCWPLAYIHCT